MPVEQRHQRISRPASLGDLRHDPLSRSLRFALRFALRFIISFEECPGPVKLRCVGWADKISYTNIWLLVKKKNRLNTHHRIERINQDRVLCSSASINRLSD